MTSTAVVFRLVHSIHARGASFKSTASTLFRTARLALLQFWFGPRRVRPVDPIPAEHSVMWFSATPEHDRQLSDHWCDTLVQVAARGTPGWERSNGALGVLASVLLLDQLPRNIFRGTARAYEYDDTALALAWGALDASLDAQLTPVERSFLLMPGQHVERMQDQERSVEEWRRLLAETPEGPSKGFVKGCLKFAVDHRDVVARFGRFPHRNQVLGRETTPEELQYLKSTTHGWAKPA
eukprot:jgi/Mesvir1/23714/Mv18661-RA.1